ncbi:Solute carrier family 22 member 6-B-like [Homarus americanus]|uniref:Solute carrier family 22 member 6-B-like n=1 Tax=Homarus americanus TaxID=6706 RepID=A0A8J5K3L5_HOMAM|nr:Solute carrier family 22 member 6-B-like [Homarus americanus]
MVEINTDGKAKYSSCSYYNRDWDALVASGALSGDTLPDLPTNVSTNTCHDWDYNHTVYKTTVVEEWDLVCDERYLTSVVQSTYMAGVLAGAVILSELSDKFGRRTIALLSSVGILVSSVCVTFTTHYVAFIILRFLVAAFGSGVFLPNFVICESPPVAAGVSSLVDNAGPPPGGLRDPEGGSQGQRWLNASEGRDGRSYGSRQ